MEELSTQAWFGFILIAVALIGAALFTAFNVAGAEGPKEKRYTRRACAAIWIIAALATILAWWLRGPLKLIPLALLVVVLPWLIYRFSMRRQMIREVDRHDAHGDPPLSAPTSGR
jgi:hypothetical protein